MAACTRSALTRQFLPCHVFVKLASTPRTIDESRAILAALSSFGEIVTFQNIYHSPDPPYYRSNGYLAIFSQSRAAETAIAQLSTHFPGLSAYPSSYIRQRGIQSNAFHGAFKARHSLQTEDLVKGGMPFADHTDCEYREISAALAARISRKQNTERTKSLWSLWAASHGDTIVGRQSLESISKD